MPESAADASPIEHREIAEPRAAAVAEWVDHRDAAERELLGPAQNAQLPAGSDTALPAAASSPEATGYPYLWRVTGLRVQRPRSA